MINAGERIRKMINAGERVRIKDTKVSFHKTFLFHVESCYARDRIRTCVLTKRRDFESRAFDHFATLAYINYRG